MTSGTLLMRLAGPLQSWGDVPRHVHLTTRSEPTKSGVVGLVCAALGRDLAEDVSDLAALVMTVREDQPGALMRDFQRCRGSLQASEDPDAVLARLRRAAAQDEEDVPDRVLLREHTRPVITYKYYLQDAHFLVALDGQIDLLSRIDAALRAPATVPYLGRKSCLPSWPLWVQRGLVSGSTGSVVLSTRPWERPQRGVHALRFVYDLGISGVRGSPRRDHPLSLRPGYCEYATRRVTEAWVDVSSLRSTVVEKGAP